jgi:hypothetical protein
VSSTCCSMFWGEWGNCSVCFIDIVSSTCCSMFWGEWGRVCMNHGGGNCSVWWYMYLGNCRQSLLKTFLQCFEVSGGIVQFVLFISCLVLVVQCFEVSGGIVQFVLLISCLVLVVQCFEVSGAGFVWAMVGELFSLVIHVFGELSTIAA